LKVALNQEDKLFKSIIKVLR